VLLIIYIYKKKISSSIVDLYGNNFAFYKYPKKRRRMALIASLFFFIFGIATVGYNIFISVDKEANKNQINKSDSVSNIKTKMLIDSVNIKERNKVRSEKCNLK